MSEPLFLAEEIYQAWLARDVDAQAYMTDAAYHLTCKVIRQALYRAEEGMRRERIPHEAIVEVLRYMVSSPPRPPHPGRIFHGSPSAMSPEAVESLMKEKNG